MKTNTLLAGLFLLCFSALSFAQSAEYGMAAYFSDKFDGNKTASGEIYHKEDLVGAHKTLPFGTKVKVTRLDNRKSVVVKIIDRGPYSQGRIIDVSRKAAEILDLTTSGVAKVKVVVQGEEETPESTATSEPKPKSINTSPSATMAKEVKEEVKPATKPSKEEVKPASKPKSTTNKPVSSAALGLHKLQMVDLEPAGYGVQVGSFSEYESMMKTVKSLQKKWFKNILLHTEKAEEGIKYRIILGPIDEEDSAQAYKKSLKAKGIEGFVVNLGEL
ncbi:MAG: septal ring lytic transglycosylase RlpA family protein [Bacteroidota bacterium]